MINRNISNINYLLSNFNIIIALVGYSFYTSVMFPIVGDISETTSLTIPFRLFTLILSLSVILLNLGSKSKSSRAVKIYFFFWILVIIRMFFDLELSDINISQHFKQRLWLYSIGLSLIPMYSVVKSAENIDLNFCLKWIYILCAITLVISFFMQVEDASMDERISGNVALDSISYSNTAVITIILSLYYIINNKIRSFRRNIIYILILLLALYIALRAGSRGPIIGLLIVLTFWYSFKDKDLLRAVIKFAFITALLLFSFEFLLDIVSNVSPVLAGRFSSAISGEDLSMINRFESYDWFINEISTRPLFGSHFARLENGKFPGYAHNIFLDIMLGFGIFGLILFLYVALKVFKVTRKYLILKKNYWIGLFTLQYLILALSSGAYYTNPVLNISIIATLVLLPYKEKKIVLKKELL